MSDTDAKPGLRLIRMKDANEAVGLAVRLIASTTTFAEFPLGVSMRALIAAVDHTCYAFAAEADRALGFACWQYVTADQAEDWLHNRPIAVREGDATVGEEVAIMLAVQGSNTRVVRFLMQHLRDGPLRPVRLLYFQRDYGPARRKRTVRLKRPAHRF